VPLRYCFCLKLKQSSLILIPDFIVIFIVIVVVVAVVVAVVVQILYLTLANLNIESNTSTEDIGLNNVLESININVLGGSTQSFENVSQIKYKLTDEHIENIIS
jgi:hypothetical protein